MEIIVLQLETMILGQGHKMNLGHMLIYFVWISAPEVVFPLGSVCFSVVCLQSVVHLLSVLFRRVFLQPRAVYLSYVYPTLHAAFLCNTRV